MAYIAVRGGTKAIEASLNLVRRERVTAQRPVAALVDQVMAEASLYAEDVASLAVDQADGSPEEAVFLLRAFRSTVPRLHTTRVSDPADLWVERRISAAFKDIPGGQLLGATSDYSHRLIDFDRPSDAENAAWLKTLDAALASAPVTAPGTAPGAPTSSPSDGRYPKVVDYLRGLDLLPTLEANDEAPGDVTKKSLSFPTKRSERLQILARGQTGAVTALGYASLRGYGALHPTVGELRVGRLPLSVADPWAGADDPDNDHWLGEIRVTEVEALVPVEIPRGEGRTELEFDLGYGLCYGRNETKAVAMALLDQVLSSGRNAGPLSDEEFVLLHVDSVEATGFISHLKLPHYVTFQSKLESVRATRRSRATDADAATEPTK
jgi:alpha-D-ribose 1-methylphosphonate 5-triphosphate synthase subunit PhnI